MAAVRSTSVMLAWPFQRVYGQRGVQLDELEATLGSTGLSLAIFADPTARVSSELLYAGVIYFADRLDCPEVGLLAGGAALPGDFGAVELAARSSATPREALQLLSAGYELLSDGVHLAVEERGEVLTLRLWTEADVVMPPGCVEFAMLSLKRLGLSYLSRGDECLGVRFTHPKVSYAHLCEQAFGCPARFDAPENAMDFPKAMLDLPMGTANPIAQMMGDRIMKVSTDSGRSGPIEGIEAEVQRRIASGIPPLTVVARALGSSPRTLRRKLEQEGTSYRDVCNQLRQRLAVHALQHTNHPIKEIAADLGYGDVQAFHRAFKRTTGQTPGQCRDLGATPGADKS